jgi:uncharacterized membrane protein
MKNFDIISLIIFFIAWLGYEFILKSLSSKSGTIFKDLTIVRINWMREFIARDVKIFDSNLLGHSINSASFFASANLLIIAAIAGAIFGGDISNNFISELGINSFHIQMKLGLVLLCLTRGFLNFIWAIRQMNYCAAAFGSIPEGIDKARAKQYADALGNIVEPAMSNFSQGVRGYYFSLAAAMWLYGPLYLMLGSICALCLLIFRQSKSQAASGLRQIRSLLDEDNNH